MAKNQSTKTKTLKQRKGGAPPTIGQAFKKGLKNIEKSKFLQGLDAVIRAWEAIFPPKRQYSGFSNPYNPGRGMGLKKQSKRR